MTDTGFPRSPKLRRGALVALRLPDPVPQVIPFQYNPAAMQRSLQAAPVGGGGPGRETLRLRGAPEETISVEIELDASDRLEEQDAVASDVGLYPELSAIEGLLYPRSAEVIVNTALLAAGAIDIVPTEGPLTLFVWGPKRILPIRLSEFSIVEEAFDPNLNPIRAKVSLGMRVLSYNDFPVDHPGHFLFLGHQIVKETLARVASGAAIGDVLGSDIRLV